MKKILLTTLLICTAIIFNACKKDKDATPDQATVDETSATQSEFDDIKKLSEDAMSQKDSNMRVAADCWSNITLDQINKTITITFDTNTICINDGKRRSGQIVINYTGKYRDSSTVITISLVNYSVNGNKIAGSKVITNKGHVAGKLTYTETVRDVAGGTGFAKITYKNGSSTTWQSDRTTTWDIGSSTPFNILDDQWLVSGTFSGVTKGGKAFSGNFSSVRLKVACWLTFVFYPVSGIVTVVTDEGTRSLDYGDGSCDKKAKFTALNGKTYDIVMN